LANHFHPTLFAHASICSLTSSPGSRFSSHRHSHRCHSSSPRSFMPVFVTPTVVKYRWMYGQPFTLMHGGREPRTLPAKRVAWCNRTRGLLILAYMCGASVSHT